MFYSRLGVYVQYRAVAVIDYITGRQMDGGNPALFQFRLSMFDNISHIMIPYGSCLFLFSNAGRRLTNMQMSASPHLVLPALIYFLMQEKLLKFLETCLQANSTFHLCK